ncbi:MAG: hypothetical protein HKN08_04315 [Gammaproteobacteria bacterium]|nr:hypothetical protein [Gammaproteobacteria bacterium]
MTISTLTINRATKRLMLFTLFVCMNSAYSQILNEDYAAGADVLILKNEIGIFSTIQQGVELSVVECELFADICSADVNPSELDQLITTIDSRINALSIRYTESPNADLEEVLVSYVDIRDGYNSILDKINTMPQFEVEEVVEDEFGFDDFFGFGAEAASEVDPEIQQLFEDYDSGELLDDDLSVDEESTVDEEDFETQ